MRERDEELSVLRNLFRDTLEGNSRIAVVSGAAGHGKTELLGMLADDAQRAGALHLSATASRTEQSIPFGVLAQLFRCEGLPAELDTRVGQLLDEALSVASRTADDVDGISPRVFHQLSLALRDLIDWVPGPLLISIDDVQYADTCSLQCLSAVVRRLPSAPVLIVLNECPPPWPSSSLLKAELPPEPRTLRLRLSPLSHRAVHDLLAQQLGPRTADALSADCLAATGGNPLLLRRLIEDNRVSDEPGPRTLRIGLQFERAVLDCLYRCDPSLRTVTRQLAVLGDPVAAPLLSRLSGLDPQSLAQALTTLEETGILVGGEWRHPRARAAVLHGMSAEERAVLHIKTATALFKNGTPVITVARHLIAAGRIGSSCEVTVLHDAAEEALADGDTALAFNCLSLAFLYKGSDEHRATTTAMLLRTEWRADPVTAARRTPALISAAQRLTGRHVSAPIDSLLWFGHADMARVTMEQIEQRAQQSRDLEASAHLHASRSILTLLYPAAAESPGDGASPDDGTDTLLRASSRSQAVLALCRVLRDGPSPDSVLVAEQTLVGSQLNDQTLLPHVSAIGILLLNDRLAAAEHWIDTLVTAAKHQSAPTWEAVFTSLAAKLALRRGDPATAARYAERALAQLPPQGWGVMISLPLSVLLEAHALMGGRDDALAQLQVTPPDTMLGTPLGMRYLRARGRALLANGQLQAALEDFLTVGELAVRWRMDVPALLSWRTDAAQIYLRGGDTERARQLAAEQLGLAKADQHRVRAVSLRMLAAASPLPERPKLLARAVEAAQQCAGRLELAYALYDMGWAHQELGQYSKGRMALRRAQQISEECRVPLPARTQPDGPGSQQSAAIKGDGEELAGTLSDAEMRVATLAARGHSNRQIAGKLFVTVSTVEQHLTRVYRKLGIKRRSDLAFALYDGAAVRVA
ncbi:AAA family ATPase [Streptomyces sp. NPDC019443]|uniref:helix-turn-helix transcriptional regulator n=1 Tax=Streptomyces sp. NPDC019443 TaxID=3365061 RepID=UPI003793C9A3